MVVTKGIIKSTWYNQYFHHHYLLWPNFTGYDSKGKSCWQL